MTAQKLILSFLVLILVSMFVAISFQNSFAAPCKPCSSWSEIKSCFSDHPAPCCKCGKGGTAMFIDFVWLEANSYRYELYYKIKKYMDNILHVENNSCHCESINSDKDD